MSQSGAILREVGTTNKTRIDDYQNAITQETAALMKVHPSNYMVMGFTESPTLEQLVELGRKRHLPVIDDIGSGALVDFSKYGIQGEPTAPESISAGADIVLFSGDKLLGGPQCGIAIGKREPVKRILKHPLSRALRVDKLTLAALSATLTLYEDPAQAECEVPLLAMLSTPIENLQNRAERLATQLASISELAAVAAVEDNTFLGGGSVPTQEISTWCVALTPGSRGVDDLAQRLRTATPSLFGRIRQDRLLLDLRSVLPRQDMQILSAVKAALANDTTEPAS